MVNSQGISNPESEQKTSKKLTDDTGGNHTGSDIEGDPMLPPQGTDAALEYIGQRSVEDPLFAFLKQSWRSILVVLVLAIAGPFVWGKFQSSYEDSLGEAGDVLAKVQSAYSALLSAEAERTTAATTTSNTPDDSAEKVKKLDEKVADATRTMTSQLMALEQEGEPFASVAGVYRSLLARRVSGVSPSGTLPSVTALPWKLEPEQSSARFFLELREFVDARGLLDTPSAKRAGQERLAELAKSSTYQQVAAALVLARIAESAEERTRARDLLKAIESQTPKQGELVKSALQGLGAD
jgi:hypothetical protein